MNVNAQEGIQHLCEWEGFHGLVGYIHAHFVDSISNSTVDHC